MPSMPGAAPALTPPNPPINVQDLGTKSVAGQMAQGKLYTYNMPQRPAMPKAPSMPQAPSAPQAPGIPQAPGMPQAPSTPQAPALPQLKTVEVWNSPQLQMPLASRVTTPMGTQTTLPQQITPGEPSPSQFQIPPGYKIIPPPSLSPPSIPKPSIPKPPSPPSMPSPPSTPSV